jgi:3-phosphoshikimate 1-carboxyvinyltransferase
VPGSKSITNRALILAALADGEVTLEGALWSEDTQIMVECLQELGFMVNVAPDPNEICNRIITVYGQGGKVPGGGTAENPLELFVGNAGTAARFLAALVCLGKGVYRLHGVPRMHERPQAALFKALRELGYRVDSPNNKLPATFFGRADLPVGQDARQRVPTKQCTVSIEESSQFASALLLCAKHSGWQIEVTGENAEESPYVAMTSKMIEAFPKNGGVFEIDSDASSASYFLGARFVLNGTTEPINYRITTPSWSQPELQVDTEFPIKFLLRDVSRLHDLGDSIMTAITLAPTNQEISRFSDLKRLRLQETERVIALRTELTKCGAKVMEEGDTLTVYPSQLHGAEIETYNDHRMAMCFAILGLKVPGIKIKNPACVKKTFPNFFQKLAAPPPKGLGATILDAKTGRKLKEEELFAE